MKHTLRLAIALLTTALSAPAVFAQPSPAVADLPRFDTISIKVDRSASGPADIQSPPDGDSITLTNMPARLIVGFAYNITLHDMIYGLPAWADSETYDITAKVAESDLPAFRKLLPRQRNPMLQELLAERFHFKAHTEPRKIPAYALVVSKSGPKLTTVEPATGSDGRIDPGEVEMRRSEVQGKGAAIAPLVDALALQLGRPVVDRTGLTGHYDFKLQFAPAQASVDAHADESPSIFTAVVEQLGLKLESTKAPVPVLVIDHIERPTEN